jgi:hypothetical protein
MYAQDMFLRVSGGNVDIAGGDGTGTSGSSDTVGKNLLTGLLEVGVGENETDVAYTIVNAVRGSRVDRKTYP